MPSHRFFFALKPSAPATAEIGRLRDDCGPYRAVVPNPRLHATLAITDDYAEAPAKLPDTMMAIGHSVSAEPVPVTLDCLSETESSSALRPRRQNDRLASLQKKIGRGDGASGFAAKRLATQPPRHPWLSDDGSGHSRYYAYPLVRPGLRAGPQHRRRHPPYRAWALAAHPRPIVIREFLSSTATGGTCGATAPASVEA